MVTVPEVGDFVEVLKDTGTITNAPWKQKVIEVKDGVTYFDEGVKVGYELNPDNLKDTILNEDTKTWVYEK